MGTVSVFNVVADFGADPLGGADSTSQIQAAVNAAQAANGGVVYFPHGTFKISSTVTVNGNNNVVLLGDGAYNTTVTTTSATADMFHCTGGSVKISDLGFTSSVTRTSGSAIYTDVLWSMIERVLITRYFRGITTLDNLATIKDSEFANPVVGTGVGIYIQGWTGGGVIDNVVMRPTGPDLQPHAGIQVVVAGGVLISNSNIMQQGIDLLINPGSGQFAGAIFATNTYFDTARNGLVVNPSGGNVVRLFFSNCWFSSHTSGDGGAVIVNSGNGIVSGIHFDNCMAIDNAGSGFSINAGTDISVNGGMFAGNTNGIWVSSNVSDFTIEGVSAGAYGGVGGNSNWGIVVAGGSSDHYIVTNNRVRGNGGGGASDGAAGPNKVFSNNIS